MDNNVTAGGQAAPLSSYANGLQPADKKRYLDKIRCIGSQDPFLATLIESKFPANVTAGHVVEYLTTHVVPGTNHLRNSRSIEAFKKFQAGYIQKIEGGLFNDFYVVRGKVSHSMGIKKPPLVAWVIIQKNGIIDSGHCTCVAGVSETCSHVSTLLFALTNLNFMTTTHKLAVTEIPSYWMKPASNITEDLDQSVQDLNYGFQIEKIDDLNPPRTKDDFIEFVSSLRSDTDEPVLVRKFCCSDSLCQGCRTNYVPDEIILNKNITLANQFKYELENGYTENIWSAAGQIKLTVTQEQIDEVERLTRDQHRCDLWRWARIGRITASTLRQCAHAPTTTVPSKMTLLKQICHPYRVNVDTEATRYGRKQEPVAKRHFKQLFKHHLNVKFDDCGLFICKEKPFLAASPDLLMTCDCCGLSTVEIKCPFRLSKRSKIAQSFHDLDFLTYDGQTFWLKYDHQYYAQVQAQIHIANALRGYFYVWSDTDKHCICIDKASAFWNDISARAEIYFKSIISPELVSNYFSNKLSSLN